MADGSGMAGGEAGGSTVIEAVGLRKLYGRGVAVDGIDFTLRRGEILGLLGPNGAGKTTTILMLLGLTEISAGTVRVAGFDPVRQPLAVKRRVGYLPDAVGFYDHLTARENLRYTARLAGLPRGEVEPRIVEAMHRVRLDEVIDRKVDVFSRGMRQRLGLAEVIMKGAEIAILDEPTSGLDPQSTFELLDMIRDLKRRGVSVLISSHLLDRVQAVCDRVALFHRGRIALQGTIAELARAVLGGGHTIRIVATGAGLAERLRALAGVQRVVAESGALYVTADRDLRAEAARLVVEAGAELREITMAEPSLDAIYRRYFEGQADAA